jgi:hypothetical protein
MSEAKAKAKPKPEPEPEQEGGAEVDMGYRIDFEEVCLVESEDQSRLEFSWERMGTKSFRCVGLGESMQQTL